MKLERTRAFVEKDKGSRLSWWKGSLYRASAGEGPTVADCFLKDRDSLLRALYVSSCGLTTCEVELGGCLELRRGDAVRYEF